MKCQKCRRTVTRKSKFCAHCGAPVTPRASSGHVTQRKTIPISYALGLAGLGILVGFLVFRVSSDSQLPASPAGFSNAAAVGTPEVLDIAREFMCPCGTCSDPLDSCDCDHKNGAHEVRGFILEQLQAGHKKPHIMEMVRDRYAASATGFMPPINLEVPKR